MIRQKQVRCFGGFRVPEHRDMKMKTINLDAPIL